MEREDILEKLDKFLEEINEQYAIGFAYLFGSFATGTYNKTSDIDIAIMFVEKYGPKKEAIIKGSIIDMGQKYFQKKTDIVSLNSATPLLRYEIIKEGIPIKESKKRAAFESLALREYFDFKYYADIYNKAMVEAIKKGV